MKIASQVNDSRLSDALVTQVNAVNVSARTDKSGGGYYLDFSGLEGLSTDCLARHPLELDVAAPDGKNRLFFHLYLEHGRMSFMELSSTGEWPEDETEIRLDVG
ncbi:MULTISPECIES: hypothetical protein [Dyella]|uniref:Uncharacterized protein n=2 Tax=Dyella TaxID=231454 RepID=A0A4R0YS27_9GAMM|nr:MULTISPECIES: hypothetical protein [Dyella]TBR40285.1 hypothetical protein EYV96_09025 [Dyella terrae]TCI12133.1 hypothetical protein EZM97_01845 [Dyella soli]